MAAMAKQLVFLAGAGRLRRVEMSWVEMMTHTFWILDKCQPLCVSGFHRVFTCSQHVGSAGKPLPCAGDPWIEIAELHVAMQRHLRAAAAVLLWLCLAQIMLSWRNWVWTSASSASSAICLIFCWFAAPNRDLSSVWLHIAVSSPTLGNHGNPTAPQKFRASARCQVRRGGWLRGANRRDAWAAGYWLWLGAWKSMPIIFHSGDVRKR